MMDAEAIHAEVERFRATRAELERAVLSLAQSLDGRRFAWQASLHGEPVGVGGYVLLELESGPALGQILEAELDEVGVAGLAGAAAGGEDGPLRTNVAIRLVRGAGALLTGRADPFFDVPMRSATADEVSEWRRQVEPGRAPLPIGELVTAPAVPATIDARGFGRHTFMCGQSGSGKTYALGVILDRLLAATRLRVIVLDPNSDFVRLGEVRDGAGEEQAARHRAIAPGVVVRSAAVSGPARLHLPFVRLADEERAALLQLDPIADREEYAALVEVLQEQRPQAFTELATAGTESARRLWQRAANLGLDSLGIWSRGDEGSLLGDLIRPDVRCLVVDLGSLPTRTEQALVAEAVLAALWRRRHEKEPVLIVIDEAHNVCPAEPQDGLGQLATDHVTRIAAEGRKFGLHLLLSTQRPQKVPENVLTQCDNLVLMRLNSRADAAFAEEAFSFVPGGLLALASEFELGHALVAGPIAPEPLLVRFGARVSAEGGGDVPRDWAAAP
jgi:hypothetical protein